MLRNTAMCIGKCTYSVSFTFFQKILGIQTCTFNERTVCISVLREDPYPV